MIRAIAVATVIIVAVLVAPAAWVPVFNSADFILIAAPFAIAVIAWPRNGSHLVEHIPEEHPDALGSLDLIERQHDQPHIRIQTEGHISMDHTPEAHDTAVDELRAAATAAEFAAANTLLDALDENYKPLTTAESYEWALSAAAMIENHGHHLSNADAAALILRLARYLPDQVVLNMAEIRWRDRDAWERFKDGRALRWIHDVQTLVVAYPVTVLGEAQIVSWPITPPRPLLATA